MMLPRCSRAVALYGCAQALFYAAAVAIVLPVVAQQRRDDATHVSSWQAGRTIVNAAVKLDRSAPLPELFKAYQIPARPDRRHSTTAPVAEPSVAPPPGTVSAAVEQRAQGTRSEATQVDSFDGLGAEFEEPQGKAEARNPSGNSLGVGRNEIVQIVNSHATI